MKTTKIGAPRAGDVIHAYLIMMWLLSGVFAVLAAYTLPRDAFTLISVMGSLMTFLFVLLIFPFLLTGFGIFAAIGYLVNGEYWYGAVLLGVMYAFYGLWWVVWYLLHGRKP